MRNKRTIIILALAIGVGLSGCLGSEEDPGDEPTDEGDPDMDDGMNSDEPVNETGIVVFEASADWLVGISGCANAVYAGVTDGVDSAWVDLPSDAQGQAFNATFESAAPAVTYGMSYGAGDTFNETFDSSEGQIEGTVPSDAENVIFWSCGGAEVSVAFTVVTA